MVALQHCTKLQLVAAAGGRMHNNNVMGATCDAREASGALATLSSRSQLECDYDGRQVDSGGGDAHKRS